MEKLDKVIAGLSCCSEANDTVNICPAQCPYYGERDGDKVCMDFLMEDALAVIEALRAERDDLRKDIAVLTEDLSGCMDECHRLAREVREAHEKLSWQEPSRTPNDWGEYPPEFLREGM